MAPESVPENQFAIPVLEPIAALRKIPHREGKTPPIVLGDRPISGKDEALRTALQQLEKV